MDFLKILKAITKDKELTRTDICVMAVLVTFAQYEADQTIEMSYSDIQAEFETIPIRTIQRSIKHLSELHYIEISRNGTQKNKYKVLIDIPEPQSKPVIKHKTNRLPNNDDDIAAYSSAMLNEPFLN